MPVVVSKANKSLIVPITWKVTCRGHWPLYPYLMAGLHFAPWYEGNTDPTAHGFQGAKPDGVVL